jgi:predicted DNA-binding protein with PD1-like motif
MNITDQDRALLGKLQHDINVAREVKALVENEHVKATLNGMLHGLQNAWLDEMDAKAREGLWIRAAGLKEFLATLDSLIEGGKIASANLTFERTRLGLENDQ